MSNVVALDYGHGGVDSGAAFNGLLEKVLNRKIGYQVRDLLKFNGIQVIELSGDENTYVSLQSRTDKENKSGAHITVSMHNNAGGGEGAEIIHSISPDTKGRVLAAKLNAEISKHQKVRRVFSRAGSGGRDYYHMIRETKSPAVIIEYGFVDNANDFVKLKNEAFLKQMAIDTVKGICAYFGVAYKEPQPPQKKPAEAKATASTDGVVHRVIVEGTQVGAFDNAESVADLVEKYVSAKKKEIKIERV